MSKKVLITGAAGFIGFHSSQQLIEDGYEVIGIDNLNNYYDVKLKKARIEYIENPKNQFTKNGNLSNVICLKEQNWMKYLIGITLNM